MSGESKILNLINENLDRIINKIQKEKFKLLFSLKLSLVFVSEIFLKILFYVKHVVLSESISPILILFFPFQPPSKADTAYVSKQII